MSPYRYIPRGIQFCVMCVLAGGQLLSFGIDLRLLVTQLKVKLQHLCQNFIFLTDWLEMRGVR